MGIVWKISAGAIIALIAVAVWLSNGSQAPSAQAKAEYADGGIDVSFAGTAEKIRVMKEAAFEVKAADERGQPIRNAKLKAVLYMPDMFCGIFDAAVTETAPGVYRIAGVPVMKGKWVVKLTLSADGREATFIHPFKVS